MSERYWITGAQLGMIKAYAQQGCPADAIDKILEEIIDKQFIGNIEKGQRIELIPKKVNPDER